MNWEEAKVEGGPLTLRDLPYKLMREFPNGEICSLLIKLLCWEVACGCCVSLWLSALHPGQPSLYHCCSPSLLVTIAPVQPPSTIDFQVADRGLCGHLKVTMCCPGFRYLFFKVTWHLLVGFSVDFLSSCWFWAFLAGELGIVSFPVFNMMLSVLIFV